jgi:hypothetical protein
MTIAPNLNDKQKKLLLNIKCHENWVKAHKGVLEMAIAKSIFACFINVFLNTKNG